MFITWSKYSKDRTKRLEETYQDVHSDYLVKVELQVYLISSLYFPAPSKFFTEEINKKYFL